LHAAGVGVWDAAIRDGSWRPTGRPKFPLVLGTDGAGIVAAKGARVRRFSVGDRVWAYDYGNPNSGFYAEYVAVDTEHAGHVPRHLDLLEAGAAAVTGLTAIQGVDDHLRVRPGETVLIFGASGAVGTLAVQFAKRHRACVVGMARGRDATALVRRLGADAVIDARSAAAAEQLQALTPNGLDAALALAGGDLLEQCLDLVRAGGRIAYPNGVEPEPRRRRKVRVVAYDGAVGPREFARLERAVTEAKLRVPIAAVYPLAQAAKAHERLERGHVLGRIVLRIRRANR
jgi:NADPH:quinone reductase-like Zn-dependent oxidoreductase